MNDTNVDISIWDTPGGEDYDDIRSYYYQNADVFLICFSLVDPTSFRHVKDKWVPEVREHFPKIAIVIVGTKEDLRPQDGKSRGQEYVKTEDARAYAEKIKGNYIECSAQTGNAVNDVFREATKASQDTSRCTIL